MDSSDEQESSKVYTKLHMCSKQSMWGCDERICRKGQFSCGDGQCVHSSAIINGERIYAKTHAI